jgi:hypothetical protein
MTAPVTEKIDDFERKRMRTEDLNSRWKLGLEPLIDSEATTNEIDSAYIRGAVNVLQGYNLIVCGVLLLNHPLPMEASH